jgi:hypothetical protein
MGVFEGFFSRESMKQECQMRSLIRGVFPDGARRRGEIFWTSEERARQYIAQRTAEPIGMGLAGPSQNQAGGPSELKDSTAKKSSSADPAGRSTATAPSSEAGKAGTLFPSPADRVSPPPKQKKSGLRKLLGGSR